MSVPQTPLYCGSTSMVTSSTGSCSLPVSGHLRVSTWATHTYTERNRSAAGVCPHRVTAPFGHRLVSAGQGQVEVGGGCTLGGETQSS